MKFDYYGNPKLKGRITTLVNLLKNINANQLWEYMGLIVEIDPTVDYNEQNILVRWFDINEGFNDKLIINNFEEFHNSFKAIND